jgi:non-heme chloroperoxidase
MGTVTTKDGTEIFYKDWGTGEPIFFHHGWPLSADDWDAQMMFFLAKGYRVIAHDRRGHGRFWSCIARTTRSARSRQPARDQANS